MPLQPVSLTNIQCGQLVEAANSYITRLGDDIVKRPNLFKSRSLVITIDLTPRIEESPMGAMLTTEIDWDMKWKVPGQSGMTTRAFVEDMGGKQQLLLNPGDPLGADPRQLNLLDREA